MPAKNKQIQKKLDSDACQCEHLLKKLNKKQGTEYNVNWLNKKSEMTESISKWFNKFMTELKEANDIAIDGIGEKMAAEASEKMKTKPTSVEDVLDEDTDSDCEEDQDEKETKEESSEEMVNRLLTVFNKSASSVNECREAFIELSEREKSKKSVRQRTVHEILTTLLILYVHSKSYCEHSNQWRAALKLDSSTEDITKLPEDLSTIIRDIKRFTIVGKFLEGHFKPVNNNITEFADTVNGMGLNFGNMQDKIHKLIKEHTKEGEMPDIQKIFANSQDLVADVEQTISAKLKDPEQMGQMFESMGKLLSFNPQLQQMLQQK